MLSCRGNKANGCRRRDKARKTRTSSDCGSGAQRCRGAHEAPRQYFGHTALAVLGGEHQGWASTGRPCLYSAPWVSSNRPPVLSDDAWRHLFRCASFRACRSTAGLLRARIGTAQREKALTRVPGESERQGKKDEIECDEEPWWLATLTVTVRVDSADLRTTVQVRGSTGTAG